MIENGATFRTDYKVNAKSKNSMRNALEWLQFLHILALTFLHGFNSIELLPRASKLAQKIWDILIALTHDSKNP